MAARRSFRRGSDPADVYQEPPPLQQPHPPIIVGGDSRAAFARAGRVGAGWFGWDLDLAETERAIASLEEIVEGRGRLEVSVRPKENVTPELATSFAALGVDVLVVDPAEDELDATIASVAHDLIPALLRAEARRSC